MGRGYAVWRLEGIDGEMVAFLLFMGGGGSLALAASVNYGADSVEKRFLGHSAMAEITGYEKTVSNSTDEDGRDTLSITWAPTFRFESTHGPVDTVSWNSQAEQPYSMGEVVRVLYVEDAPEAATIDSFEDLWLLSLVFSIIGLVCIGGGASGFVVFSDPFFD